MTSFSLCGKGLEDNAQALCSGPFNKKKQTKMKANGLADEQVLIKMAIEGKQNVERKPAAGTAA